MEISMLMMEEKKQEVDTGRLLTVPDVRNYLGCGTRRVLQLIDEGHLEALDIAPPGTVRTGWHDTRGIRISPESLRDYLDSVRQ
jgi:hypothetical protein